MRAIAVDVAARAFATRDDREGSLVATSMESEEEVGVVTRAMTRVRVGRGRMMRIRDGPRGGSRAGAKAEADSDEDAEEDSAEDSEGEEEEEGSNDEALKGRKGKKGKGKKGEQKEQECKQQ